MLLCGMSEVEDREESWHFSAILPSDHTIGLRPKGLKIWNQQKSTENPIWEEISLGSQGCKWSRFGVAEVLI